jgi:beta-phosphoglucomutase-like phosphatase (HAD superfamily)
MIDNRGVIFDLDGVLINSEPLHCRAFQDILAPYGAGVTEEDYYGKYLVYSDREVLEWLLPDSRFLDEAVAAKERRYWELLESGVPVFQDGLALLAKTAGWRVGLATGSIRREAEMALRCLGIRERFDAVIAREDCRKGKPDPEPFLRAAGALRRSRGRPRWGAGGQDGGHGLRRRDPLLSAPATGRGRPRGGRSCDRKPGIAPG